MTTYNDKAQKKSFWQRPEGITGMVVLAALLIGGGYLLFQLLPVLIGLMQNILYLSLMLLALGAIVYVVLDPKMRSLISIMYQRAMRWLTGLFVQIDPVGILRNYVEELKNNLSEMNKQISKLRGQMHKLRELIYNNNKKIESNLAMASKAKANEQQAQVILKTRKAGRLRESNMRLEDLYKKMEVLYRTLNKMYDNSQILLEDVKDQVELKEQERKAIHASYSAMQSAKSVISGDPDRRAMFDAAMEAIADDVGKKVGEMERFMEMSSSFMESVDLQNGIFEEEGLKMLEKWEKESESLILGDEKEHLLLQANNDADVLDLDAPVQEKKAREPGHKNQYDSFFDF